MPSPFVKLKPQAASSTPYNNRIPPAAHANAGIATQQDIARLLDAGNLPQAEQMARLRIARHPGEAKTWYLLGAIALRANRVQEARQHLQQALKISPRDAVLLNNAGKLLLDAHCAADALPYFEKAALFDARTAAIRLNCAVTCHSLGRFDEAAMHYRQAITLDRQCGQAYLGLVNCRKFRCAEDAPLIDMVKALAKCVELDAKVCLHYALAKVYDDLDRCEEAFAAAECANALQRAKTPFNTVACAEAVTQRCGLHDTTWFAQHRHLGHASDMPILVVGMPRSGTTLVEQMLSAHHMVGGAGELTFWDAADKAFSAGGRRLDGKLIQFLAQHYCDQLASAVPGKQKVIDKMPDNFHFVGLFHAIFPKGKIIHCRRNPLDTCLSIYFHKFTGDFSYAHGLEDLRCYYEQYQRLTDHWRAVLPVTSWLDVDYESLVASPAQEAQRMTQFLALPFDAAVLRPEANPRALCTSSAWQARQPIYQSAQGKWRRYAQHLAPLMSLESVSAI